MLRIFLPKNDKYLILIDKINNQLFVIYYIIIILKYHNKFVFERYFIHYFTDVEE